MTKSAPAFSDTPKTTKAIMALLRRQPGRAALCNGWPDEAVAVVLPLCLEMLDGELDVRRADITHLAHVVWDQARSRPVPPSDTRLDVVLQRAAVAPPPLAISDVLGALGSARSLANTVEAERDVLNRVLVELGPVLRRR